MKRPLAVLALSALLGALIPGLGRAQELPSGQVTDLPVLSAEVRRGMGNHIQTAGPAPTAKTIDGDPSDWVGRPSRYGGTAVYSGGEFVYQDHLFDAHGADDGRDTSRLSRTNQLEETVPETYRLDALAQANAPGEFGVPVPDNFSYNDTYGDASPHQETSDLSEVRVALGNGNLNLLARTTTMKQNSDTALLVLADTIEDETAKSIPFNTNLTTTSGDVAFFIADGVVRKADLTNGGTEALSGANAAANPAGWVNALEASIPTSHLARGDGSIELAIAAGKPDEANDGFAPITLEFPDETPDANVANVAFRLNEPVRTWFEKDQALSLHDGTIDPFFLSLDSNKLTSGYSEQFVPGHGYHDRIFISDASTGVPEENGRNGVLQHYGVYLPESYTGEPVPLQWWLHWRGGNAHTAGNIIPKMFKQLGEDRDTIVVSPSGRGTGTWYNGRGHLDVRQVWADVFDTFAIDRDHVYVTGHSMGGWGSYLLSVLYPDRFAAAAPFAGPVTQGAWTGADFEGCDEMKFEEYTPCYIDANGSRPRDQHTRKILENMRHVPVAIFHGTFDELVPYSGVARQAQRFVELGYRHRFYTSPGYEHYTHPIADQWSAAGDYLHSFTRPEDPSRVTYFRDMPFERATEEVQAGPTVVNFSFDSAYWMSDLQPTDNMNGVARFDGSSLAIPDEPYLVTPDSDLAVQPGQTGPFVVTGLQWLDDPTSSAPEAMNGFDVTLTGARRVGLDLERMSIDSSKTVVGAVSNDAELNLALDGGWRSAPTVTVDGQPASAQLDSGLLTIVLPPGSHTLSIEPGAPEVLDTSIAFTEGSDDSAQYSDTATLQARLTDATGDALSGEQVTFSLGSQSAAATTGGDGVATVSLPVREAPGDHHATVGFSGRDGELAPSVGTTPFRVDKEDTALDLEVTGTGGKRLLSATLTDPDSSAPVAGRTIVFSSRGTEIGRADTNESGVATFKPGDGYGGKKVPFEAAFAGDALYLRSGDASS